MHIYVFLSIEMKLNIIVITIYCLEYCSTRLERIYLDHEIPIERK